MKKSECFGIAMRAVIQAHGFTDETKLDAIEILFDEKRMAKSIEDYEAKKAETEQEAKNEAVEN